MALATPGPAIINLTSLSPPLPIPPILPDFHTCAVHYGRLISRDEADLAGGKLAVGTDPSPLLSKLPNLPIPPPSQDNSWGITINVEAAPTISASALQSLPIIPNAIRGMAGWVIQRCVANHGQGGYTTLEMASIFDYIAADDPRLNIRYVPYPLHTVFLTLTISGPNRPTQPPSPGDFDPRPAVYPGKGCDCQVADDGKGSSTRDADEVQPVVAGKYVYGKAAGKSARGGRGVPWWGLSKTDRGGK